MRIEVRGVREIKRELRALGPHAQRAMKARANAIADRMTPRMKAAGNAQNRQAARAAKSVKAVKSGQLPTIKAGGTAASRGVVFGSEFGAKRRFGWYSRPRYHNSVERQFRPHLGGGSYWFFRTAEQMQPEVARQWQAAADDIIRQWRA